MSSLHGLFAGEDMGRRGTVAVASGALEFESCLGSWQLLRASGAKEIPGDALGWGSGSGPPQEDPPLLPSPLTHKGHEAGLVNEDPGAKAEDQAA